MLGLNKLWNSMNRLDRTLLAGPWVGEFGWELFAWQAYIRSLSRHYSRTIIICREGSKDIYQDFADEFYFHNIAGGASDAFFMHGIDLGNELKKIIKNNNIQLNSKTTLLTPRRIGWPPETHYTEQFSFGNINIAPEYIIFSGEQPNKNYDFVFHARNRQLRIQDNWDPEKWKTLLQKLGGTCASIGSKEESLHIEGTDDLRGIPLANLFSVTARAKCVFGPSSGPMHLSSLCNTPHLVWSRPENRLRYEENWNPHKTPVLFLDEHSWHPSAEYVYEKYMDWKHD